MLLMLPVVNELSHEFKDRCSACWVMVPKFYCPLQNRHVSWVSTVLGEGKHARNQNQCCRVAPRFLKCKIFSMSKALLKQF